MGHPVGHGGLCCRGLFDSSVNQNNIVSMNHYKHDKHEYESDETRSNWKGLGAGLIGLFFRGAQNSLNQVRSFKKNIIKGIISGIIMLLGGIFFLLGLSLFINDLAGDRFWPGFLIIGAILAIIGISTKKIDD